MIFYLKGFVLLKDCVKELTGNNCVKRQCSESAKACMGFKSL